MRWVSAEPLLGPINLRSIDVSGDEEILPLGAGWLDRLEEGDEEGARIDWIVAGGESGNGARPMHPDWVRSIRDQCASAGVPFLFKQWGEWMSTMIGAGGDFDPLLPVEAFRATGGHNSMRVWQGNRAIRPSPDASVADFFKPNNVFAAAVGKKLAGRMLDGVLHDAYPQVPRG